MKQTIETFRNLGAWELSRMKSDEPTSFNGEVRFKKYRVMVEEIEEPVKIYEERLQKLWDECDNHHQWQPLKLAANSIGYTLIGQAGNKSKKR